MHPVKCSTRAIVVTVISGGILSKVKLIYKCTTKECSTRLVIPAVASVLFSL